MSFESKLFREATDQTGRDDFFRGEIRDELALLIEDITGQNLPPKERVRVQVKIFDEVGSEYDVELECTGAGFIYPQASLLVGQGPDERYHIDLSALPGDITHADYLLAQRVLEDVYIRQELARNAQLGNS